MSNPFFTKEHKLIENIKHWCGSSFIGDDCAIIDGHQLITSDTLVENTHFLLTTTALKDIGWKAVAVNLSDIAAMGGLPKYLMVSLTVPEKLSTTELETLYSGINDCARTYNTQIVGGDLTKGPILVIAITALGETSERGCLKRSGASMGDVVVVSGDFGASCAGLWLLKNKASLNSTNQFKHCIDAHILPKPSFAESWKLVEKISDRGALMDASDGLADALVQIARASNVGMSIDLLKVPVNAETKEVCKTATADLNDWVMYGGEDYHLVGTMPKDIFDSWKEDNPFTQIGIVTQSGKVEMMVGEKRGPQIDLSHCFQQINH